MTADAAGADGLGARTAFNAGVLLLARVLSKLAAFVVVVGMWNHLGAGRYGQFSTIVTLVGVAGVAADLGLTTLFTREGAADPGRLRPYLDNITTAKLPLSLLAVGVLTGGMALSGGQLLAALAPAVALMLAASYSTLLRATFYVEGRLALEAWAIVGETLVLSAAILWGIATDQGTSWFIWSYAISYAFTVVFCLSIFARRGLRISWSLDLRLLRSLLAAGIPFALASVITTLYFKVDVLLLVWYGVGFEMVGWYTSAYKYIEAVMFVPTSLATVLFPAFAALHAAPPERLISAYRSSYRILAILGMPVSIGMALLPEKLIALTHGFPQSVPALRILALALVVIFTNNALIVPLTAIGRQWDFAALTMVSLVFNLAANAVLIPPLVPIAGIHGYTGAAWATVLTEIVLFAGAWWRMGIHLHRLAWFGEAWRPLAAGLLMAAPVWGLRAAPLWVTVPLGAAVYLLGLFVFRALGEPERSLVRGGVSRLRRRR